MKLPEKITTYGGPKDLFVRIIDRPRFEGDTLVLDRTVILREPADFICLKIDTK